MMFIRLASVFWFLASGLVAVAQISLVSPLLDGQTAISLADFPPCALTCLLTAVTDPASPCLITNQTCICASAQLQTNFSSCLLESCTVKESLVALNASNTACGNPVRNRQRESTILSIVLLAFAVSCVLARMFSKLFLAENSITVDDCIITGVVIGIGIPSTVISILKVTAYGLGRDIWTLSPDDITNFGYWLYVLQIIYSAGISIIKISLLFFYVRIFPAAEVQLMLKITMVMNAAFGVAFVLVAIFECQPISFFWTGWDGEHQGSCININGAAWSQAAVSIALDLWMLGIPLSQLPRLKLHWKKKIGVGIMFFFGTFITVVSILRLQTLVLYGNSRNPTWDSMATSVASTVELNVGTICTCLPTLRVLLVRLFPALKDSTMRSRPTYHTGTSNHRGSSGVATTPSKNRNSIFKIYDNLKVHKYAVGPNSSSPGEPELEVSNVAATDRRTSSRFVSWDFVTKAETHREDPSSESPEQRTTYQHSVQVTDSDQDTESIGLPRMGRDSIVESQPAIGLRPRPITNMSREWPLQTR